MEADRLPAGRVAEAGVGKLKSGAACTRADAGAEAVPGRDTAVRWALERLFVRLLPMLERWAHGRLPRHARRRCDTEDLVQDACSGAIRHLSDLDERDPAQVDFYLKQSIRNRIRDEIRRSRIGETTSSEGLAVADPRPSPLDDSLESDERRRFRAALLALDVDDQQLVVGRVELRLSYDELARATGRDTSEAARCAARRAMFRLAHQVGVLEQREKLAQPGERRSAAAL